MKIRDTRNGSWYWVNIAVNACTHISHADKSVYGALASFGGCEEIRPSFEEIAKRSNTSVRQSKTSVKNLCEVELVKIEQGGGRGRANIYNLLKAAKGCKFCTVSKGCNLVQKRVQNSAKKGAKSAPQIDKEEDKEIDKHTESVYPDDFLSFWNEYPKKVGKGEAFRAWKKIKSCPPISEMLSAVKEQREQEQWKKENGRFIPNPATWLNGRRWEDEIKSSKKSTKYEGLQ